MRLPYNPGLRAALLGCSAAVAINVSSAVAQTAPDQGAATLQEIVVTAQKREQSMQDVPIAVTAVTQDVLRANRITNVNDLNAVAPNVTVRPAAGGVGLPTFTMRGVLATGVVPGADKEVSLYIDGVYIGSATGSAFELPDMERIEVLRGPQGTLFGRNATAGAISVVTRNPAGRFGVRQELTYGNYNQVRSHTRIDLPQVGPISASINYVHDQRNGDIKNLAAGQVWDRTGPRTHEGVSVSPKTLGDKNTDNWFVAVRFDPTDNFSTVYKFDHSVSHGTPEGTAIIGFDPTGLSIAGPLLTALMTSNNIPFAGAKRPDYVSNGWTTNSYERVFGHNVTSTVRVNDHLSLKNILAYRESFTYANDAIDGIGGIPLTAQALPLYLQLLSIKQLAPSLPPALAAQLAQLPPTGYTQAQLAQIAALGAGLIGAPVSVASTQSQSTAKQFSDEFQLNFDSKYLTLTTGALYFHLTTTAGAPDGIPNTPVLTAYPGGVIPIGVRAISYNYATSTALYTQAEVHVTPQVDIVGGYRITRDLKSGTTYVNPDALFPSGALSFDYRKTKPSYMLGLNYKPVADTLLYAKFANGFVSGGAVGPIAFDPETVRSWEIGAKSDLLHRRLRVNLALFDASYRHLQAPQGGVSVGLPELGTVVVDEGSEKARGFEAELTALPVRGLTLSSGIGYTDVSITTSDIAQTLLGSDFIANTARPKWTADLAAAYESQPVIGDAIVSFRIDAHYQSKERLYQYPEPSVPAYEAILFKPSAWILNGRLALQRIKLAQGSGEIALWARNLTNNRDIMYPIAFGNPPFIASTTYQAARTFGLDVIYDY